MEPVQSKDYSRQAWQSTPRSKVKHKPSSSNETPHGVLQKKHKGFCEIAKDQLMDVEVALTVIERAWQPLVDTEGPTKRLDQFLRGLAGYIIDECWPKCSTVVPPSKMLWFFDNYRVQHEYYPWHRIFGGEISWSSISRLYLKLGCEHHLVQPGTTEPPSIPSLTPVGFSHLMTILIWAHPSNEYERLKAAVLDLPISNADDAVERFPKALLRRQFPPRSHLQSEQRLVASLDHEQVLFKGLRNAFKMPPPPPYRVLPDAK